MSRRLLLPAPALALLSLALLAASASAQHVQVEEIVLDNGMTFLLCPRHEEPNTVSCAWVAKVGSANERPGITGISHFFEHMMFKGTTTIGTSDPAADADFMHRQKEVKDHINALIWGGQYDRFRRGEIDDPWDPANDTDEIHGLRAKLHDLIEQHRSVINENEFDKIYRNAGATGMNAFTSNDMTFYFITVPANKFELWAWMESNRLDDSVFREFYSERDVVHEERRMRLESTPTGRLEEQFDAMFWQSSPYSWAVVGWPSDLNSYTREEFDAYFNIYYRPNNLVGVVAGDFEPTDVKPLITRYFGRLTRGGQEPPPVVTYEVEQLAEKRLTGTCDCQPQVEVRYHTVPFDHHDSYALQILTEILNGRTGRLYKSMIEGREIAASARANQRSMKYAGYLAFSAEVKGEATPADLEAAWEEQAQRLQNEPVSAHELQKVQNRVAADSYRRLQSNSAILFQLGMFAAMGDWHAINDGPRKLAAVTADDLKRVAATYLIPTNRCVAVYTRRPGTEAPSDEDVLASFPPEARAQVQAMLQRFLSRDDPEELRRVVTAMEGGRDQWPEAYRPVMEYVLGKLKARIAELESKKP